MTTDPAMLDLLTRMAEEIRALKKRVGSLEGQEKAALTAGSVAFGGANGRLAQDNANFFFDDANNRLGIGVVPTAKLDVKDGYIRGRDGTNTPPTSGMGVEILATSAVGYVLAYDRDASLYKPLNVFGTPLVIGDPTLGMSWRMRSVTLANNGTAQFSNAVADLGFHFITTDNNQVAIYFTAGTLHSVGEIYDSGAVFTVTAGAAASTNIYWDATDLRYEIENKTGAQRIYKIWEMVP